MDEPLLDALAKLKLAIDALNERLSVKRQKLVLHPNSLTIPRTQLEGFLGSQTLANECARELTPVRNQSSCVIFDRKEVEAWYLAEVLANRTAAPK